MKTEDETQCLRCAELEAILQQFVAALDRFGDWDDNCFYYHGHSATELQQPLAQARAAITPR